MPRWGIDLEPYSFRKLSKRDKEAVLEYRKSRGMPWHAPPHFSTGEAWYLITAATYEHRPILATEDRRNYFQHRLLEGIREICGDPRAWVVLSTHYHLIARLRDIRDFGKLTRTLHRGTAFEWNRVDGTPGRTVWYRYRDDQIRDEEQYYAYLNYVHANPVKHGLVKRVDQWLCSSVHGYLREFGREYLRDLWRRYPPAEIGEGWDDID